jgi:hypothetical protein
VALSIGSAAEAVVANINTRDSRDIAREKCRGNMKNSSKESCWKRRQGRAESDEIKSGGKWRAKRYPIMEGGTELFDELRAAFG